MAIFCFIIAVNYLSVLSNKTVNLNAPKRSRNPGSTEKAYSPVLDRGNQIGEGYLFAVEK